MKAAPRQVMGHIPGEVFRTRGTENLYERFNEVSAMRDTNQQLLALEELRDDAYKYAHDIWSWPTRFNANNKFHSAYAIFHAAKKMADKSAHDAPLEPQSLTMTINFTWNKTIEEAVDKMNSRGSFIEWSKKHSGLLLYTHVFIGERKSIEALRDELSVLRRGDRKPLGPAPQ